MAEQKYAESRPDALHPEEPFFFLRGQDVLAPHALQAYAGLLRAAAAGRSEIVRRGGTVEDMRDRDGGYGKSLRDQAQEVERIAARMMAWQIEHRSKLPD